jgi:hypothetical protein
MDALHNVPWIYEYVAAIEKGRRPNTELNSSFLYLTKPDIQRMNARGLAIIPYGSMKRWQRPSNGSPKGAGVRKETILSGKSTHTKEYRKQCAD